MIHSEWVSIYESTRGTNHGNTNTQANRGHPSPSSARKFPTYQITLFILCPGVWIGRGSPTQGRETIPWFFPRRDECATAAAAFRVDGDVQGQAEGAEPEGGLDRDALTLALVPQKVRARRTHSEDPSHSDQTPATLCGVPQHAQRLRRSSAACGACVPASRPVPFAAPHTSPTGRSICTAPASAMVAAVYARAAPDT